MEEKFYKLKRIVEELESYRGRHTELISVYIPSGHNIFAISNQLEYEKSMAENIKSKATRENVISAIEMILRELKFYKKTPPNGLAIFAGNVSKEEGRPDLRIWTIEPPYPLSMKLYHCDQTFFLQPLKDMLEARKDFYGLIVIDKKEATLGMLEGKMIKKLLHLTSGVPSKIRAGGQSSVRFERLREGATKEFYRRVSENAKQFFLDQKIKGILVGGPGMTKEEFLKEGDIPTPIKEKIIAIKDIGYADEHGLKLLVEECQDILANVEVMEEKKKLREFFDALVKDKAIIGLEKVKKALAYGAADKIFISETIDEKIIDEIEKENISKAEINIVSKDTEEGLQFSNLGGIGAILRFKIEF